VQNIYIWSGAGPLWETPLFFSNRDRTREKDEATIRGKQSPDCRSGGDQRKPRLNILRPRSLRRTTYYWYIWTVVICMSCQRDPGLWDPWPIFTHTHGGTNTITPSFVYNWPIKHHEDNSEVFYNYCRSSRNDYDYPPLFSCTLNSKPQLDERVCSTERRGISVELLCVWMFWSIHDMLGLWYAAVWWLLLLCGWAGWWVGPLLRTRVKLMPIAVDENNYLARANPWFFRRLLIMIIERVKVTISFR
jgi:hypothetical protein